RGIGRTVRPEASLMRIHWCPDSEVPMHILRGCRVCGGRSARRRPGCHRRIWSSGTAWALVSDRTDPKFVHLDGVNLSRAWCWKSLGNLLAINDPRREIALQSADSHLATSLPHIADDYAGAHWLATFAALALDGRDTPPLHHR